MTKKLAALGLAIALPALASASDLNPGALQLSGKSSFDWGKESTKVGGTTTDVTRLDAGVSAMYYVSQFLAFGLEADYRSLETDAATENSFLFGPKAGIDYELMRHFSVFADATVGMVRAEAFDESANGWGLRFAGGFRLFLNSNASLDLFGAYTRKQVDFTNAGKVTTNDVMMGVGVSVYLTNNPANADGYRPPAPPPPAYR